ncbi:MAG: cupin domain-containing protein [Pseudomonadota bacterium]
MALPHAQPLDVIDVRPLADRLLETKSHSLLKTDKLQLMRVVLQQGEGMPPHHVEAEVVIECIEGRVTVTCPDRDCVLEAGQLVVLPPGEPHSFKGEENSSLLVTLLLHQQG